MKYLVYIFIISSLGFSSDFYYEYGKKVYLEKNKEKNSRSINTIKEYKNTDGKIIRFKNEIIVQCKDKDMCLKDIENLNLTDIRVISKGTYLIVLNEKQNIFELSQKLYEKDSIVTAHPNFIKQRVFR